MDCVKDLLGQLYAVTPKCDNLSTPEHVVVQMLQYRNKRIEYFVVFLLDAKNNIISKKIVSKGTVDTTAVYPREVMRYALLKQACSIIVAHNHPGGDPNPSRYDIDLTKKISDAANTLNIRFLDHVVVARNGHYSFQEQGII